MRSENARWVSARSGADPEVNSRTWLVASRVRPGCSQQPHVEGRHAHHAGRLWQQPHDLVGIEFGQENHRATREQQHVAGDEQPMGMEDRQCVQEHVVARETPRSPSIHSRWRADCHGSASLPWSGRSYPKCRGLRRGHPNRGRSPAGRVRPQRPLATCRRRSRRDFPRLLCPRFPQSSRTPSIVPGCATTKLGCASPMK